MRPTVRTLGSLLALLATTTVGLAASGQALATQAGLRQLNVAGVNSGAASIPVALFYPTQAPARDIALGPFTLQVAMQAPPDAQVKGLILLSHGTGGTELGHASLAQALARNGYLVAALRHPGDNWQDRSLLKETPARYFDERPRQVSRVIDALLADPEWKARIATDAAGPRIGALGHSAGGYTVLALAGGQPQLSRLGSHCASHRADDPIFCAMGAVTTQPPQGATPGAPLADSRVRAVVAMAPVGAVFSEQSLQAVRLPVAVYEAQQDRFLVPKFHAEWIATNLPDVEMHRIPNALHFAFMDAPSVPIPTEDGDIRTDLPGFDRAALLQRLGQQIPAFFDRALR